MTEWKKFIDDYKESYDTLYEDIDNFVDTYQYVSSIPALEVRKLLGCILVQIGIMADAGKNISNFIEKKEKGNLWEMPLEEFNYSSLEKN